MYERVADLTLDVDEYAFERRERATSSGFDRVTTTVALSGDGETGRGEDVTYDADDHDAFLDTPVHPDPGEYTLASFSAALDDLDLFPEPPDRADFRHYRRWGFESAALDLALRQADTTLGEVLGRTPEPVEFVVSTRLDEDPDRVQTWLDHDPSLAFKLDPTPEWTADLVADLADTGRVRVLDFKGQYEGTEVETPPDPDLYRLVAGRFPDALLEDPALTDETREALSGHEDRITWDVPITGVESIRELPFEPEWLNCKPSRFGTVESLLGAIDYCEREGIDLYGGGQFELGVGRGQIQELAALFYPDSPNDVAPGAYNDPEPKPGLPSSPLDPPAESVGFGW